MSAGRVVVVDDDAAIRSAARLILEAVGFEVREYASAADALLEVRREQADAAIVDFDVAHREGVDLAEAICRNEELEVALIGAAFDLARVDLSLVDLTIQKPYATLELAGLVESALGAR